MGLTEGDKIDECPEMRYWSDLEWVDKNVEYVLKKCAENNIDPNNLITHHIEQFKKEQEDDNRGDK